MEMAAMLEQPLWFPGRRLNKAIVSQCVADLVSVEREFYMSRSGTECYRSEKKWSDYCSISPRGGLQGAGRFHSL